MPGVLGSAAEAGKTGAALIRPISDKSPAL